MLETLSQPLTTSSAFSANIERPLLRGKMNFPVCLAPMVGLSHVAFRLMLREYLPEGATTMWSTEMLNSRRIPDENLKKTPETMRHESETDLVPQILGNEAEPIAKSCARLEHEWGASGIDINMGCPVKKALSHNYGVALMGDSDYAAEVVRMTVTSTSLPVSVKLRAGHQNDLEYFPVSVKLRAGHQNDLEYLTKFIKGLEQAGASWVTLHPRTTEQKRRGAADWSQIRQVREQVKIPIIGNGDIQVVDDFLNMREQTGCDAVMIGRALTARPWLLWQIGEKLGFAPPKGRTGSAPQTQEEEGREYGLALRKLAFQMQEHFPEGLGLRKFRFFVKTGGPWLLFGHDLHARTTRVKTWSEIHEQLDLFFAQEHTMCGRTELRQ
ncbi:MAG: tRNA-dihydrouridine synthase family protein [Proteobacteria bacterium]|nr:MAG: tRNA-dihydrouridine synthase family protein [Pseudomonadota bacterium]